MSDRDLPLASRPAVLDPALLARILATFERVRSTEPDDPTAAAFATATADGRPSVRMVLCKTADARGFHVYTNFGSRKGRDLAANPYAALVFHWAVAKEQLRVEGAVERIDDATADAYFASRPRLSQLGAWASDQSQPLESRAWLEGRLRELETRYEGQSVPRPPFWGGYVIVPERIELWREGPFRLHERESFTRDLTTHAWSSVRLNP